MAAEHPRSIHTQKRKDGDFEESEVEQWRSYGAVNAEWLDDLDGVLGWEKGKRVVVHGVIMVVRRRREGEWDVGKRVRVPNSKKE
ncbi:hypothetical protein ACLOJK_008854 [Asimina triloba]